MNATSGQGKKNGLSLLLDYQDKLSLQVPSKKEDKPSRKIIRRLNFEADGSPHTEAAKVHIDTLSPFTGSGGGIYQMRVVKRMTTTEDFLKMPLKERNCKVELFENCRTTKLLEGCKCVPGEMPSYQVKTLMITFQNKSSSFRTWEVHP